MTIFKTICGIIVEYNPFHFGHAYHIRQSVELSGCDLLIAVMSPNIVQRGEFAVIDKKRRAYCALNQGVDLVIELPSIYVLQKADIFAWGAIRLLDRCGITDLCFGSETNDIDYLSRLADLTFDFDRLKEELKTGVSYPGAVSRLVDRLYPNDILAVAYLKILSDYPQIRSHILQRTNTYKDREINDEYASATAIRHNLHNKDIDLHKYTPLADDLSRFNNDLSRYYDLIRYSLMTSSSEELSSYLLVDEGIENHLKSQVQTTENYDDFLHNCVNRRYTTSRIQRTLMNILLKVPKSSKNDLEINSGLRILGFNDKGRDYLKTLNKKEVPYSVKFKDLYPPQKDLEYRIAQLYQMYYQDKSLLKNELSGPLYCPKP